MKNDIIKPVLALAAICLVVSAALALVNDATHPAIEAAANDRAPAAMSQIIPQAGGFELIESDALPEGIVEAYSASDGSGYIFIAASGGFGGEIRVMCGIDNDGGIIKLKTLQHNETKGLGDYIDSAAFTDQFDGLGKGGPQGIDAVTGATISFNAFVSAVDYALDAFEILTGR